MKSHLEHFEVHTAKNLKDALCALSSSGTALAGGTDIMVYMEKGLLPPQKFVSIWNVKELRGIKVQKDYISIGALEVFADIKKHPAIKKEFPMLARAASLVGAIAIQNRATIAGNIANASPAADSVPALLAYDAELEIVSEKGVRVVALADFYQGYKKTALNQGELIRAVRLPRGTSTQIAHYYKVGTREMMAISKVVMAVAVKVQNGVVTSARIAMGSVGPHTLRLKKSEEALLGQKLDSDTIQNAQRALTHEIGPISDIRSTREYRLKVAENILGAILRGELK